MRPAAGVALGLLGAALLLAGCNSTDAGSAPTVTPAPSTVASPSPSSAPALAQPAPTATPVASASPTASPAISGARPAPVVDPKAPQSLARGDGSDPDTGRREPDGGLPRQSKGQARSTAPSGVAYTWRDGDRVERVFLATDLTIRDNDDTRRDDELVVGGASESIVRAQSRNQGSTTAKPVFRSQAGGLMTLPGGVLLALDPDWDQARVDRFFSDNSIDRSRVQERDWAVNAFFVTTEPGFPSLNLANDLAGQEGVLISSPNWRTQVTTR